MDTGLYITYQNVPWHLRARKELFSPKEETSREVLALIFKQIAQDIFIQPCIRLNSEEKEKIKQTFQSVGVNATNFNAEDRYQVHKKVVDFVRELPLYFTRLYPVKGGRSQPNVHLLAVSHSGVRLVKQSNESGLKELKIIEHLRYEDIISISVPQPKALQLQLSDKYVILYTPKAEQIRDLLILLWTEVDKVPKLITKETVKTTAATKEDPFASIRSRDLAKGDTIKSRDLAKGDTIKSRDVTMGDTIKSRDLTKGDTIKSRDVTMVDTIKSRDLTKGDTIKSRDFTKGDTIKSVSSVVSAAKDAPTITDVPKHSMLEFAALFFTASSFKGKLSVGSFESVHEQLCKLKSMSGKDINEAIEKLNSLIKWTETPISEPLLMQPTEKLRKLSIELFKGIMQYMGDLPMPAERRQEAIAYTVIAQCKLSADLVDEIYCQLMKQTTSNRNNSSQSCLLGWRLFTVFTSYFYCSDTLRPYLLNYLRTSSYGDEPYHDLAQMCLNNLSTTYQYGGRTNPPSRAELDNLQQGRLTKRQAFMTSGGKVYMLNISYSTIVEHCVDMIWQQLNMETDEEMLEYGIFYVIEAEGSFSQLNKTDYILDIATKLYREKKVFYFLFQRTSWIYPLNTKGSEFYIDMMYNQCLPDFLDGFLLMRSLNTSRPQLVKEEIAQLAVCQLRAENKSELPIGNELQRYLPAGIESFVNDMKLAQWSKLVEQLLSSMKQLSQNEAKRKFLEILSTWPLFGSTFYQIKSATHPKAKGECLLALNKNGLHLLHPQSHDELVTYEIKSNWTTKHQKRDIDSTLEIYQANSLLVTLVTNQAADIMLLIRQLIQLMNLKN